MVLPWEKPTFKVGQYPDESSYVVVDSYQPHIEFRINLIPNPNPDLVNLFEKVYTTNSKGIGYNVGPLNIMKYE